jgi:glutamine synthetase
MTPEQVLEHVHGNDVRIIRLWFTDILGKLKGFAITPRELEKGFSEGLGFDGSSIEGFVRIHESDLVARPDPGTYQLLPWSSNGEKTARLFCDILNPDRTPYDGDPRHVLKCNLRRAKEFGFAFNVGPEVEYFYLKDSTRTELLDDGGYFDVTPMDVGSRLRKKTVFALESLGIPVEVSHHEVAPSQHEIDLRYQDALTMADHVMTYRLVVKEVAREEGVYATFMPKPVLGVNGSGMHTHQSLFRGERNAFFDGSDPEGLSETARHYLAGILTHAVELTSVICQWVNSYKRLVPGYEAPAYVSWARRNRSTLVRIPMYKPGKEEATRIEFRAPDPACNPYLAFSVMLAAGLRGIEKRYRLPEPIEADLFEMSSAEREQAGVRLLPDSLYAAILETEKSELVREALGENLFRKFIANKKAEWDAYRIRVTDYEIDKYLPML